MPIARSEKQIHFLLYPRLTLFYTQNEPKHDLAKVKTIKHLEENIAKKKKIRDHVLGKDILASPIIEKSNKFNFIKLQIFVQQTLSSLPQNEKVRPTVGEHTFKQFLL